MITKSWIYDAIIYMYALSLLFYFSDFAGRNQKAKRMGTGLLAFVWVLQTVFFAARAAEDGYGLIFSTFGFLFLSSWLLVSLSLVLNYYLRIDILVFIVNVFGFAITALNFFSDPRVLPVIADWNIADELLFIHITFSIFSYVAFLISAIFSGMYLFLHRKLKEKSWSDIMKRLPSLERIESYTYHSVVIGTPLFILSLTLGVVWLVLQRSPWMLLDPKVLGSLSIIAAYAVYLFRRFTFRLAGNQLAVINLAAFAVVMINYLFMNFLSAFHQ